MKKLSFVKGKIIRKIAGKDIKNYIDLSYDLDLKQVIIIVILEDYIFLSDGILDAYLDNLLVKKIEYLNKIIIYSNIYQLK